LPKFKEETKQKTASGLIVSSGQITQSIYDDLPIETLITDITKMRNADCIASSSLRTMKMPLIQAGYTIDISKKDSRSQEIIDYCYWALEKIDYQKYKYHKLLALDYGFALFEKVKGTGEFNGKPTNCYMKLAPIQPDTVYNWTYEDINLIGIKHIKKIPNRGQTYIDMTMDDLIHYTYNAEFENPQGNSVLRPARLYFISKQKLISAFTKSAIKGTGVVHIQFSGNVSDTERLKIEKMARTVAIEENAYMTSQEGKYLTKLEQVQGMSDIQGMLEYFDKQMLFLTSSQFTTVGVNTSGSFAAAQTIKTIYELSIQSIKKDYETHDNELLKEIIDMSPYAGLKEDEYPTLKLDYNAADLNSVATNLQKIVAKLNWTYEDEVWLRSVFGLPEAKEIKEEPKQTEVNPGENPLPDQNNPTDQGNPIDQNNQSDETTNPNFSRYELEHRTKDGFISPEFPKDFTEKQKSVMTAAYASCRLAWVKDHPDDRQNKANKEKCAKESYGAVSNLDKGYRSLTEKEKNFELSSAIEHYQTISERSKNIMKEVYSKILKDIANQINNNKSEVDIRYKPELLNRLSSLYREGINRGSSDMIKEIGKVALSKTIQLNKYQFEIVIKENKQISKKIDNFYQKLKYSVEHEVDRLGIDKIKKKGTLEFAMGFEDKFKRDQSELTQIVESSYNAGRSEQMELFQEDYPELKFTYSAILDNSLCNDCASKDGLEYTLKEIEEGVEGVTLDKAGYGINEDCLGHLGGNRCRCVWIVIGT
jgi:hypothetical protein